MLEVSEALRCHNTNHRIMESAPRKERRCCTYGSLCSQKFHCKRNEGHQEVQNVSTSFYLSDVTGIAGNHTEAWAIKGKRDDTRSSKWEWPIQQRPPTVAWKVWNKAIKEAFAEEEDITYQLGEWYDEGGHQHTELHLDAREGTLYRCKNGKWVRHEAKQRGRLRFENECVTVTGPQGIKHKAQATLRSSYIEV
jgi:hypothetical protein